MNDKLIKIGGIAFILTVGGWLLYKDGPKFFSKPIVEPRDPSLSPGVDRRADHDRAGNPVNQTAPASDPEPQPQPRPQPVRAKVPDTISEAFEAYKSEISDSTNLPSKGSVRLALWSKDFLRWNELNKTPSTTFSLAMKDMDDARGKRMCLSGLINQIEAQKVGGEKIYEGGMGNYQHEFIRFIAVGSTGSLVAQSDAKFCGIVTEKLSYESVDKRTIHSLFLVGMFDLPENRTR
jgi:hypothetical protein